MKKSTIAVSSLAILALAWAGTAWYTGKQVEHYYYQTVEEFNQNMKSLSLPDTQHLTIQWTTQQFKRGIFSTDIQDKLIINGVINGVEKHWEVPLENKIYHGPFPLNQLASFHVVPKMLAWQAEVIADDSIQQWFAATQGLSPATIKAEVSYQQKISGTLHFADLHFTDEQAQLDWHNFKIHYDDLYLNKSGKIKASAQQINFQKKDKLKGFSLENASIDFSIKDILSKSLYIGQQQYAADRLVLNLVNKDGQPEHVVLKDWKITQDIEHKDNVINVLVNIAIDQVQLQHKDLGKVSINGQLDHLDVQALEILSTPDYADEQQSAYDQAIENILQNQPHLLLTTTLENNKGKLVGELNIALAENGIEALSAGNLLHAFNQFDFKLDLNKESLQQYIRILHEIAYNQSEQQATSEAQALMKELINNLQRNNLVIEQEKSLVTQLALADNKQLIFNGEQVSEQQLQLLLLALVLGW